MIGSVSRWLVGAVLGSGLFSGSVGAAEVLLNGHRFTMPDGFTVERVDAPGLVPRPVSASFDDQGRLYVTDSSGSNEAPDQQLKNPTHRVLRLEDTDGDGVFDRSVVFADKVMFPQGCLWHQGSVYVAGPPSIWKFTDTDGDGVADRREEWFKGGTLTGCANDIHGPHLGPDGYLYWTKGAFAEQTHTLANGRVLKDKAAHIYRARPDGSGLDVIMNGGMDNPVEIAFTPEGEAVFTSTFIDFSQPGFRDGIAHAVYGGVFGKENDVLNDGRVKRTGPDLFHPFHQAGPAAECGLMRYEGDAWGAEYRDNLFATTFNLHKVTRHVLRPDRASYASTDSDLLVADDPDFHPTDVLQDVDGHLLVVDTGGWYKLCCPSSQLAKPDVLGAIYRIRKVGVPAVSGDARKPRLARLVGPPSMAEDRLPASLKRAVWSGDPKHAAEFRELVISRSKQPTVGDNAAVLRTAAEGLGRLRDRASVEALLAATSATEDPFLTHAYIFALIEIADPWQTRNGLKMPSPRKQRAALIALDQMEGGDLKPTEVAGFLGMADEPLRRAAQWILGRHPEWGGALAGWFRTELGRAAGQATLTSQLRILTQAPAGQELLADLVTQSGVSDAVRLAALKAMAEAGLKTPPEGWITAVRTVLTQKPAAGGELMPAALRAARTVGADDAVQEALRSLARDGSLPAGLRLEALAALPAGGPLDAADFAFARGELGSDRTPAARVMAAGLLARARLTPEQQVALTDEVKTAGPLELTRLLAAFDGGGDDALGRKLVAAVRDSHNARALTPGQIQPHLAKFPESTRAEAATVLAAFNADAGQQAAHLETLLREVQSLSGDTRRGQAVFNGSKAACSSCHRIGYLGGDVGPELTKIGEVRSERDLLESLIYPSASFVRSYEPTTVVLAGGDEVSGILRRETDQELLLVTGPGAEQRVPRSQVAEVRPGTVSVMPGGYDQALTRQELADLLTFVKTVRWR